ncbi:MAG: hypothetical protein ACOVQ5_00970 [Flavobacteriales bacterium]|jgi:hypothetical protein
MLDNLLQLVKENASEAIINNPAIPNERNDEAISLASNGIFEGLKDKLSGGGLQDIFSSGNAAQSGATNQISGNVAGQLMEKFGLDNGAAKGIVEKLIPVVMEKFVNKTNDPNDNSFDLGDIVKNLGGSGGIGGMLGGLFGK